MIYSNQNDSNMKSSELEKVLEVSISSEKMEEKSFEDEGMRVTPISETPTIQISGIDDSPTRSSEIVLNDSGNSSIADTTTSSNLINTDVPTEEGDKPAVVEPSPVKVEDH